ncbi:hypothetical protein D3C71_1575170 [compost metagenome]
MRPKACIFGLVFEERDDLHQFGFGFINAGDIGKGHPGIAFHEHFGPGLADVHQSADALFFCQPAKQEMPDHYDEDKGQ